MLVLNGFVHSVMDVASSARWLLYLLDVWFLLVSLSQIPSKQGNQTEYSTLSFLPGRTRLIPSHPFQ